MNNKMNNKMMEVMIWMN